MSYLSGPSIHRSPAADLSSLSGGGSSRGTAVPRPRARRRLRVLIPLLLLLATGAVLAYSGRQVLRRPVDVRVAPVILTASDSMESASDSDAAPEAPPAVVAQAAGWVEAAPFATTVSALVDGVVSEVHVLEGQRIEAGDIVATLIDDDARLVLERAQAEQSAREAAVGQARVQIDVEQSRADHTRLELDRKAGLVTTGGVPRTEVDLLRVQLRSDQLQVDLARAALAAAEAALEIGRAEIRTAELALERTRVRSPIGGVVMARLVEPGVRISMNADAPRPGRESAMNGAIVRLYDPANLQVRVDVPLADAGLVGPDAPAEITTEALPGRVLRGRVIRTVHEADIQRNTVQFKVGIDDPDPVLKPEMLTRVRLFGRARAGGGAAAPDGSTPGDAAATVWADARGLSSRAEGPARAWVVRPRAAGATFTQSSAAAGSVGIAAIREVRIAGPARDGYVPVSDGLRPGDRLIIDPPPDLRDESPVRIIGEAEEPQPTEGGA